MDPHEEKLKSYMQEHSIAAEHIAFEKSCHSVAEAAEAAKASSDEFVKNICMIDSKGELILAIVKGEDRASTSRVAKALGIDRPRTATPNEIIEKTGYPCGGTPSFGFDATFLVDPRVEERKMVFSGGGSARSLIRIPVKELLRANNGRVVRVRK